MDFYIINIGSFLVAITLLTLTPGLDTALVIRNTTRSNSLDGCITSLGICCGLFVHATLSAIGISAILQQSAELFQIIKLIGAAYLIYLGITGVISIIKSRTIQSNNPLVQQTELGKESISQSDKKQHSDNTNYSAKRSFREGLLSNILNPKTAVFYMAFLPQFINPNYSPFLQSLFMALIHFIIAMIWQCGLSITLHSAKNWLQNSSVIRWMEGTTSIVLIALGLKLALDN